MPRFSSPAGFRVLRPVGGCLAPPRTATVLPGVFLALWREGVPMTTTDSSATGQAPPVPLPIDVTTVAHLQGPFAPVIEETDAADLPIEGELPRELDGVYLRNGPNPRFTPIGS